MHILLMQTSSMIALISPTCNSHTGMGLPRIRDIDGPFISYSLVIILFTLELSVKMVGWTDDHSSGRKFGSLYWPPFHDTHSLLNDFPNSFEGVEVGIIASDRCTLGVSLVCINQVQQMLWAWGLLSTA
ncbi:hypothetical protein BD779DRAFT_444618 [Infundibulicybe gibba]|nr:hypothetical protein BD779DRAFT_444618 [Infundibulicybe gibba]